MNRDWVLWHLREAQEAIEDMIREIEATPDYGYAEFSPGMQHLYHHLNTAWNAREAAPAEVEAMSDGEFTRWSQFPKDLMMMELGQPPN